MCLAKRAMVGVIGSWVLLCPAGLVFGQGGRANSVPKGAKVTAPDPANRNLDEHSRFAYDVVRSAVALPQGEAQDRLRVLAAAAKVIAPIRPALAKTYSREGLRVEQELIERGEEPVTSMLSAGPVDCSAVQRMLERVPPPRVSAAEPTLVAAVGACEGVTLTVQRLIEAGLEQRSFAPRATLAVMEKVGVSSAWSREKFAKVFAELPKDAEKSKAEAPALATLYAQAASGVEHDAAKASGVELLLWLGKLEDGGDRRVAVNVLTEAMKMALGEKDYEEALASDVAARQVAESAGAEGEITRPVEESASVLLAMQSATEDRAQELERLPNSQRAREAAASGFASGSGGDKKLAARYFDLAFQAVNAVWSERATRQDAAEVVSEVCEAAAQVDAVDALRRARGLEDSAAQAIGMIAVARVVGGSVGR